jgi:hypothetical protein
MFPDFPIRCRPAKDDVSSHLRVPLYPEIADTVAWSDVITRYDQEHFVAYARILDAERANASWREAARVILRCDPDKEPARAWACWETHLARAKWIATKGLQQAIARSGAH